MTNHRQEYLKYLLEKERWTLDEKEWMYKYLDQNELYDLETIATEEFNMDVASFNNVRDSRLSEEVLRKIHQRIEAPQSSLRKMIQLNRAKWLVAACVLLVLGWGYLFFRVLNGSSDGLQHVRTAGNERKTVSLPDGSLVSLESGTSLDYPKKFSGQTREVNVKGEAFFEIAKDTAHPFIVRTEHIKATVLGTSFNVESYEAKDPRVVVVTGKVRVQTVGEEQTEILMPDQGVVYRISTGELQRMVASDEVRFYKQRKSGKLIYRGVALDRVVADLQRSYNTTITIEDSVKTCLFYGDFFTGDKLDKALNIIAISLNATVKKDKNNSYLIAGGSCR